MGLGLLFMVMFVGVLLLVMQYSLFITCNMPEVSFCAGCSNMATFPHLLLFDVLLLFPIILHCVLYALVSLLYIISIIYHA